MQNTRNVSKLESFKDLYNQLQASYKGNTLWIPLDPILWLLPLNTLMQIIWVVKIQNSLKIYRWYKLSYIYILALIKPNMLTILPNRELGKQINNPFYVNFERMDCEIPLRNKLKRCFLFCFCFANRVIYCQFNTITFNFLLTF